MHNTYWPSTRAVPGGDGAPLLLGLREIDGANPPKCAVWFLNNLSAMRRSRTSRLKIFRYWPRNGGMPPVGKIILAIQLAAVIKLDERASRKNWRRSRMNILESDANERQDAATEVIQLS